MNEDIVPKLLDEIKKEFNTKFNKSEVIKRLLKEQKNYKNAYEFAKETGVILSEVLGDKISAQVLPDSRMYYNIADRILNDVLGNNHKIVTSYLETVQSFVNKSANINLKPKSPKINQDKVNGFVNRLNSEENFDDVKWILKDPVVNFTQSVVDDFIMTNVDFHAKVGLVPKLTRTVVAGCCEFCEKLAGMYTYPVDKKIYMRHNNCYCIVEYHPKDSRGIQSSHTKMWR
ncbi:TPA: hypothetical protein ACGMKN_001094 [Streptococcus agalactiae]